MDFRFINDSGYQDKQQMYELQLIRQFSRGMKARKAGISVCRVAFTG